ncbi:MAG: proline--tRNA ligase [Candidatus Buchananbacteria bacterium]
MDKKITSMKEDYSQWYLDIIDAADLSENSSVRGCMVIKPYGYAIWEKMQKALDGMFKETGVQNAYFPLFIPLSFLNKEAEHVEGFAKECAVVTHHRLEKGADGKLKPAGELEEPLVVRPTSETIIYDTFSKWVNSYRDLPLLINQWANIVRWELRTRPFLRTMEFLWQEGHTAHATKKEADEKTLQMIGVYKKFCEEYMAMPVIDGMKTETEKFAGAEYTTCIEALMQDGKALQAGTSHMLGQNFAKAFEVKFLDDKSETQYVWQTSWGVSTRLIGALIMSHSDDKGLVLPPKLAPIEVVMVPIWANEEEKTQVMDQAENIIKSVKEKLDITIKLDSRDLRPGARFYEWEKKGVPIRIEIGPKDIAKNVVQFVRRDSGEKFTVEISEVLEKVSQTLDDIQSSLLQKSQKFLNDNITEIDSWDKFKKVIEEKGGFLSAHWCGDGKCEEKIKEETKATIACVPFDQKKEKGKCILCGKESKGRVLFAKSY